MKTIITILSLLLAASTTTFANNGIAESNSPVLVHEDENTSFTLLSESALVTATSYDEESNYFTIETASTINFLQVINSKGELEYQLPIGASILKLALPDFEKGTFQINLLMEGENKFVSTELVKKN